MFYEQLLIRFFQMEAFIDVVVMTPMETTIPCLFSSDGFLDRTGVSYPDFLEVNIYIIF